MTDNWTSNFRRAATQCFMGGLGLALLTFICFRLGLDLSTAGFAYLILLALVSLMGSFIASAILSVVAVASLIYFFSPPPFSFQVDQQDVLGLAAFLTTSMIVARLTTKREHTDKVLLEQARLLDLTHDTIFVRDLSDVITYWNRGAEELYGWTRKEALGKVTHQLIQTVFPAPLAEINADFLRTGRWDGELVHTKRDGTQVVVASRWSLQRDEHGRSVAVLETNNDITERKRAESELRASERRHRYIFQATGVSIWEQDFSRVKTAIDDLRSGGVQDFRQYFATHPEFVRQAITMVKVVDVNDVTARLFAATSKDELLVSLHKIFLPETEEVFMGELIAIAEGRTSFEAETVLQTLNGERLTVLFTMTFPPLPARFESVLVSVTDITERKCAEAERARLGDRLREAEKMEAVGRLAGGVAHDFNNVLAGILAYGEMLFEEAPADSARKRYAQNVLTAATRGRALVEQILAYSRSRHGARTPADICRTVAETLELVKGSLPANIRVHTSAPTLPLVVIADATQLHQVMMNLCSNAIQAMSAGGTLRVALEAAEIDAERAFSRGTLKPGRYARLTVEDSGSGMHEATLSRIFEPFFTTKEIGRGTGLGLSLVDAIVTDLAGAIDVKSALTQGSTFRIYLPLAEVVPATGAQTGGAPPPGGMPSTIVR